MMISIPTSVWAIFCLMILSISSLSAAAGTEAMPPSAEKAARASSPPAPSTDGQYGEKFDLPKSLMDLKQSPNAQLRATAAKEIVVRAKVAAVCPKKGCWMKIEGKEAPYMVSFRDYGFFVPTELIGKEVALKGHFVPHKESVAEQKHLAEDARKSKAEIDAITTDKETLRFVATGVRDLTTK